MRGATDLPVELVRDIFLMAGAEDRPTAFSLLTVSKTVHDWVRPLLYDTIVCLCPRHWENFKVGVLRAPEARKRVTRVVFDKSYDDDVRASFVANKNIFVNLKTLILKSHRFNVSEQSDFDEAQRSLAPTALILHDMKTLPSWSILDTLWIGSWSVVHYWWDQELSKISTTCPNVHTLVVESFRFKPQEFPVLVFEAETYAPTIETLVLYLGRRYGYRTKVWTESMFIRVMSAVEKSPIRPHRLNIYLYWDGGQGALEPIYAPPDERGDEEGDEGHETFLPQDPQWHCLLPDDEAWVSCEPPPNLRAMPELPKGVERADVMLHR